MALGTMKGHSVSASGNTSSEQGPSLLESLSKLAEKVKKKGT